MREVNNEVRAGAALAAITSFAKDLGEWYDDLDWHANPMDESDKEMLAQNIGDFIADLMHLCDAVGLDYDVLRLRGEGHHEEEVWEEQEDKHSEQQPECSYCNMEHNPEPGNCPELDKVDHGQV